MSGSTVVIDYTAPGGTASGITSHVLFADAYFESQFAAVAGSFQLTVEDEEQTLSFVTGGEISLTVDGTKYYGGYITQATRTFALPVDDTVTNGPGAVKSRQWKLSGVDYNLLLDKCVLRNTSDYTHQLPSVAGPVNDGDLIRDNFGTYFDLPSGTDVTTHVVNVNSFADGYTWNQQGDTMRQTLDAIVIQSTTISGGADATLYFFDGSKNLHYLALQNTSAPWGFSDSPSASGSGYIGFRDGSATEDGTSIANDVFVWGGSAFGSGGTVVLGHATNSTSITDHGRWQLAETNFGDSLFATQGGVNARANALVSGSTTGTSPVTGAQGLVNPDLQFVLTWFAQDVPWSGGSPQHLTPGYTTTLELWTFSQDGGTTPFTYSVPLRQVQVTFPNLDASGNPYVQFTGTFGIQLSDPVWLWQYLLKRPKVITTAVSSANNSSTAPPYGSIYQGIPSPATDGTTTAFTIPFAYIGGTLQIFKNGLALIDGTDYTETDPSTGSFTMTTAPASGANLYAQCRTA